MTEKSYVWGGIVVGDATESPYDDDEWSDLWRKLFTRDRTTQGVIDGYEGQLVVSNPAGNTIRVPSGAGIVDGKFYENTADIDNILATPAALTRVDRFVLRKTWATQEVRVTVITGVEGAGVPSLVQIDGTTWDIPLAAVSITTGDAITITDERSFCRTPLLPELVGAYTEIETIISDGTLTSIDFSSIPSDYKHLVIIGQGRLDGAGLLEVDLDIRFNGDGNANYENQQTKSEHGSATGAAVTGQTHGNLGQIPAATALAGYAGVIHFQFPNYTGVFYKNYLGMCAHIPNATIGDFALYHIGGTWQDVSVINRIVIFSTAGAPGFFVNGSTYTLYGLG